MKRALLLVRVSTSSQEDEGTSIASQEALGREYADSNGLQITSVCREVYSGADILSAPFFAEERENIRQGRYEALIAYSVDRLSRNIAHLSIITDECERHNCELHFVTEKLDDTAEGKLLLSVKAYVAEVEREKIKERTARGKLHKLKQGLFIPGPDPYGYIYNRETKQREIVESEAELIREIFTRKIKGESLRDIALDFNRRGIPPPSQGKRVYKNNRVAIWHLSSFRKILANPSYCGKTYAMRFKRVTYFKKGKRVSLTKDRDRSEWMELKGITPPIVSEAEFLLATHKTQTGKGEEKRNTKTPYLLRGMIYCLECGQKLYPEKDGKRRIYRCSSRGNLKTGRCSGSQVSAEYMEIYLWEVFKEAAKDLKRIRKIVKQQPPKSSEPDRLIKLREKIDRQIAALGARIADADDITWGIIKKQISDKNVERDRLTGQINQVSEESHDYSDVLDRLEELKDIIDGADFELKRLILTSFNVKVFASGKKAKISADLPNLNPEF